MRPYLLLVITLLVIATDSKAQDISGEWHGNFTGGFLSGGLQELVVNLQLYDDSLISGTSHLYYSGNKYEHYKVNGVYHKADSTIYFSEDEEIDVSLGVWGNNVLGSYDMTLQIHNGVMRMDGKWRQHNNKSFGMMNSKVWLEKPIPKPKKVIETQPEVKPTQPAKPKAVEPDRKYSVQGTIQIGSSDTVRIELTDNYKIDGDVISLYVDDSLVLHQQKITDKPLVLNLTVHNKLTRIKMIAISQGSEPPCTAHMVVTTADERHEQDLWSDHNTSCVIELVRE